ncbi:hypothetical protein GCM10023205_83410 [Yinghuangia aomiensis]|uniref:Uncharacterized protein n=1 Tax=Yinghuangia aomiensis TaxID=676205 RepID=A0ABP9IGJ7_9ACTN
MAKGRVPTRRQVRLGEERAGTGGGQRPQNCTKSLDQHGGCRHVAHAGGHLPERKAPTARRAAVPIAASACGATAVSAWERVKTATA